MPKQRSLNKSRESDENLHLSVLLNESLRILSPAVNEVFIDATLGLGGHSEAILEAASGTKVIGIDQDPEAIANARERLSQYGERITIVNSNFADIKRVITETGHGSVDGIIADLGVSSLQLDTAGRGFSFRFDAPLDMRMNPDSDEMTAAELLAELSETEIADIIYQYGEERFSRRIARRIVQKREAGEPVTTTAELARLVEGAVRRSSKDKIHPATRTFQALRIAVNREIEILEEFVADSIEILKPGGRMAVIAFHSLEDRAIKRAFQKFSGKCSCPPRMPKCMCGAVKLVEILTKKPVVPTDDEMQHNPRSRSAKLRGIKKLDANTESNKTEKRYAK